MLAKRPERLFILGGGCKLWCLIIHHPFKKYLNHYAFGLIKQYRRFQFDPFFVLRGVNQFSIIHIKWWISIKKQHIFENFTPICMIECHYLSHDCDFEAPKRIRKKPRRYVNRQDNVDKNSVYLSLRHSCHLELGDLIDHLWRTCVL